MESLYLKGDDIRLGPHRLVVKNTAAASEAFISKWPGNLQSAKLAKW
jgi:hypothetical protein